MKKSLVLSVLILIVVSCTKKQEIVHDLTSFKNQINDTISPLKEQAYAAKLIYVNGYVDDSVYVSFGRDSKKYLTKEIDTSFSAEYYGEGKAIFIFDPYKAKKGKLKIKFLIF